jgi:sugar phosphate isomerase/epimerase
VPGSRRRFLAAATAAGAAAFRDTVAAPPTPGEPPAREPTAALPPSGRRPLCFFTKPLPALDVRTLSRHLRPLGFDGLDLTVRPGGHVLPDRAAHDLPRAVASAREEGLDVPMITTALTSADDPTARPILETAARLGVRHFKAGYYLYESEDVRAVVERAGREFAGLVALASACGIQAGFHNHSAYVGAALWDAARFVDGLDPAWAGYYFDPRHAFAEGGAGAWRSAARLAAPRLKMIAAKDFRWVRDEGRWKDENVPLGGGTVDWDAVLAILLADGFAGPVSLHIEYEPAGPGAREERVLAAAASDLAFLKARLAAQARRTASISRSSASVDTSERSERPHRAYQ